MPSSKPHFSVSTNTLCNPLSLPRPLINSSFSFLTFLWYVANSVGSSRCHDWTPGGPLWTLCGSLLHSWCWRKGTCSHWPSLQQEGEVMSQYHGNVQQEGLTWNGFWICDLFFSLHPSMLVYNYLLYYIDIHRRLFIMTWQGCYYGRNGRALANMFSCELWQGEDSYTGFNLLLSCPPLFSPFQVGSCAVHYDCCQSRRCSGYGHNSPRS